MMVVSMQDGPWESYYFYFCLQCRGLVVRLAIHNKKGLVNKARPLSGTNKANNLESIPRSEDIIFLDSQLPSVHQGQ